MTRHRKFTFRHLCVVLRAVRLPNQRGFTHAPFVHSDTPQDFRRQTKFTFSPKGAGFTLIELVIAVFLFGVMTVSLSGIYLSFVRQNRNQLEQQVLQQDIQSFFETLDREIRTGFSTTFDASTPGTLSLKNQDTEDVTYDVDADGMILRNGSALTSDRTEVRNLQFDPVYVATSDDGGNSDPTDDVLVDRQGRVTVSVKACPNGAPDNECIDVQTTITSRQTRPPT